MPGAHCVALEKRKNGSLYYYRSDRRGGRVRRVYVASGELARIAHEQEIILRAARDHKRLEEAKELDRLEAIIAPVLELEEAAEVLARAHLIAAGCHRRKGGWRRARSA
jgi:hypothetical protein